MVGIKRTYCFAKCKFKISMGFHLSISMQEKALKLNLGFPILIYLEIKINPCDGGQRDGFFYRHLPHLQGCED